MPMVRTLASRTTANVSASIASSDSPCSKRLLNSAVLAWSSASESAFICASKALTARAVRRRRATSRSLPSIMVLRNAIGLLGYDSYPGYGARRTVESWSDITVRAGREDVNDPAPACGGIRNVNDPSRIHFDVGGGDKLGVASLNLADRLGVRNLLIKRREYQDRRSVHRVTGRFGTALVGDIDVPTLIERNAERRDHLVLGGDREARGDVGRRGRRFRRRRRLGRGRRRWKRERLDGSALDVGYVKVTIGINGDAARQL